MFLFLAALAQVSMPRVDAWAVLDFRDLRSKRGEYGRLATTAMIDSLADAGVSVVPPAMVQQALKAVGAFSLDDVASALHDAGEKGLVPDELGGTTLTGEFSDARFVWVKGGRYVRVALRLVAYDSVSGLPVGGEWEEGDSAVYGRAVNNDTLVAEATRQATFLSVRSLRRVRVPVATVPSMCFGGPPLINRGTHDGYTSGLQIVVTRGRQTVGLGHIGIAESDQAELVPDLPQMRVTPGDHVRIIVEPPRRPSRGMSVFDCEIRR